MSGEDGLVAVDVGNSAVKLAFGAEPSIVDHAIRISNTGWELAAIQWAHQRRGRSDLEWRIASVHRAAADRLTTAIARLHCEATIRFVTHHDVPMPVDVDDPDRLGIDRLLTAFAARNRRDPPAVVIDAGSAVTVDWVSERGHYCGGAILPGLCLQSTALAVGTDALPPIDWDCEGAIELPAKNTANAIRSGILAGVTAGIDGLIDRYQDAAGLKTGVAQVVLTGGDGPAISPHLRHLHHFMPNLVCRGLLDLPRSWVGQTNADKELG